MILEPFLKIIEENEISGKKYLWIFPCVASLAAV